MRVGAGADGTPSFGAVTTGGARRAAPLPFCRSKASPPKYIASCTVQPTPSASMRSSDASEASLRCAIDQRSGASGTSRFTRSKMSSSWPNVASDPQCIVSPRPRPAAHRAISS